MATLRAFVRSQKKGAIVNVRFRFCIPGGKIIYYVSEIQINVDLFDNKRETIKPRVLYSDEARRIFNEKIEKVKPDILKALENRDRSQPVTSEWLASVMGKEKKPKADGNIVFSTFDEFMEMKGYSGKIGEHYAVLKRIMQRYASYKNYIGEKFEWSFNIGAIDLSDFENYLKNEYEISFRYPSLYDGVKVKPRGRNTVINMLVKLRVFYLWANRNNKTPNNPFKNFKIKEQVYGRPYYLTIEERDRVYNLELPNNPFLAVQRDIFIFQCLIGCRVSDLVRMTKKNINNGAIEYVPKKTSKEHSEFARVPLTPKAIEILKRYEDYEGDTIFPCISPQKYNESIKRMLKMAGIDRLVTVINPITQEEEQRPIYEIASSHLARRTFIGNVYKHVKDPNIVGAMSGHVEGSKAFARYRDIDDEIKRDALKGIE